MLSKFAIGAVIALMSTSAMAADLIIEQPEAVIPVSAFDWSGFYVGGSVGYGWGDVTVDPLDTAEGDSSAAGWLIGAQLGANAQFDSFVLGVEGDISWSNINNDSAVDSGPWFGEVDVGWLASLRGRAGIAYDKVLFYATAGVAGAGVEYTDNQNGLTGSGTHLGWTAGVGVEAALTDNVSVKLEYAYYDFGVVTYDTNVPDDVSFNLNTVRAGVNFHF